jgi:hypothetical protein
LVNCAADAAHTPAIPCASNSHRAYLTSLEQTPLPLQTHLAYSDNRGVSWTTNEIAAVNPSFIDRPWLAVYPGATALSDKV